MKKLNDVALKLLAKAAYANAERGKFSVPVYWLSA